MPMEDAHRAHLARLTARVSADLAAKYEAGQQEHGGNIWEKPGMLAHAYEEVLDLLVYILTEMEQRDSGFKPNGRNV